MAYLSPTRMEVYLDALKHNYSVVRELVGPGCEIIAVMKADAYGHGAIRLAHFFGDCGCRNFAVARVEEGVELRKSGIAGTILVLGQAPLDSADAILDHDLTCACAETRFAEILDGAAHERGKKALVHVKIDTGMGRLGFKPHEFAAVADALFSLPNLTVDGIFTHFAAADESRTDYTDMQFGRFKEALSVLDGKGLKVRVRHACNSAGIMSHPDKHLDAVRPGIMLYGSCPLPKELESMPLKPTFSFKSAVASLHTELPSSGIGYGLRYITRGRERIAAVPVGYGDGWTRTLSMKIDVLIRGRRCPVLGTICMDQIMVDVTDLDNVDLGDEVVLLGRQGSETISVEEIAALRGTITYEIPIALLSRVRRVYV